MTLCVWDKEGGPEQLMMTFNFFFRFFVLEFLGLDIFLERERERDNASRRVRSSTHIKKSI